MEKQAIRSILNKLYKHEKTTNYTEYKYFDQFIFILANKKRPFY